MSEPLSRGGDARRRALLEALAIGALVLLGTWLQRGPDGLQAPWLAFVLLLGGPAFGRWLVVRGRSAPAPLAVLVLEFAAFAGAFVRPLPAWALALEGAAALAAVWPAHERRAGGAGPAPAPASGLERAAPLALGALALAWLLGHDPTLEHPRASAPFAAPLLLATFALAPGAARTVAASARRFAGATSVAALAILVLYQDAPARFTAEGAVEALALLAGGIEALAFARERGEPALAPGGQRRAARLALGAAIAAVVFLLVPYRLLAPERRLDLAGLSARHVLGYAWRVELPRSVLDAPATATLLEDGAPLPLDETGEATIATVGSGRSALSPGALVWSSSDGSDPLANGRRYQLAFRPAPQRSLALTYAAGVVVGLLLLAWSLGAVALDRPSSPRVRLLVPALVAAALAAGLPDRWDRIAIGPDSASYVQHSSWRPPLYPAFLDALDARPGEPRSTLERHEEGSGSRASPGNRYLGAVHAQKVLAVLAVALLAWVLAGSLNAWLVGAVAWLAIATDTGITSFLAVSVNVEALLSDGLNHALVFAALAVTFAELRRPRWSSGLALATLLALLLLGRPANAPLVLVLGVVWLRHAREAGARAATVRAGALALVMALPLLLACGETYRATGYFRLHSFTGPSLFCTTLSLATPEDVDAFPEPTLHELVRRCVVEESARRVSSDSPEFVNTNLYTIGLPALEAMNVLPAGPTREFVQDDILAAVAKRLVRRHPVAFARLVLFQLGEVLSLRVHGPLVLGFLACALLWWRRGRPEHLFGAWLALLPVLAILPSCAFNVPLERYRSQLAWVEWVAIPLLLALAFARERRPVSPAHE